MNRRALIITNPGESGAENYCPGVLVDESLYRRFLTSPIGGAWKTSEITLLQRPGKEDASKAIKELSSADYSLAIFCGHGYHSTNLNTTMLELRKGQELDANVLAEGTIRRTVLLDCCRTRHMTMALDEAMMKALAKADAVGDPTLSRRAFDAAVGACRPGLVKLFGCTVGESANDDSARGGVYSFNLVEAVRAWGASTPVARNSPPEICSVVQAHNSAAPVVQRQTGRRQNPTITKPMSGSYFPLGVKVA